jgi:F-type H+-transporting ATPase subunit b
MEILNQLGGLFLAAVPTVIIVFLFYLFLRWVFFRPIMHVMAERRGRIEGARQDAESLRKQAHEKIRAYQDAQRSARAEIFAEQETARRSALEERAAAVQQTRNRASEEVQSAKLRIRAEIEAARAEVESTSQQLAEEIARAILEPHHSLTPRPAGQV